MIKLHFIGTCSGTEPLPGRRHQAFAVEINGALYWFDAGACASITAHLMGLDLLSVKKVVVSHPHMDHVGGLGNLFWDIRKLMWVHNKKIHFDSIELYIPHMGTWEGFLKVLDNTEWKFSDNADMTINAREIRDGVLFSDENMKVTAFHNTHLGVPEDGAWRSFTFRIEAEGKRIVYSGDIGRLSEMDEAIGGGCDAVLAETGHHHYLEVCDYMNGKNVKALFFTHVGRSILEDPIKAQICAQSRFEGNVMICSDATTLPFE